MKDYPDHSESLTPLKRIEGQLRGIQSMIEKKEYCCDILNQIHAAMAALAKVQDGILEKHLAGCVTKAVLSKSEAQKKEKFSEIISLIRRFRKL